MRVVAEVLGWTMTHFRVADRVLAIAFVVCTFAGAACSVAEGHDRVHDAATVDATVPPLAKSEQVKAPRPPDSSLYPNDLVGLTQTQLEARHGRPFETHGNRWIYRLKSPGCSDVILSEVFTFKKGRVANVTLQRQPTTIDCNDYQ